MIHVVATLDTEGITFSCPEKRGVPRLFIASPPEWSVETFLTEMVRRMGDYGDRMAAVMMLLTGLEVESIIQQDLHLEVWSGTSMTVRKLRFIPDSK